MESPVISAIFCGEASFRLESSPAAKAPSQFTPPHHSRRSLALGPKNPFGFWTTLGNGIDITYLAINLVQRRLRDTFHSDLSPYEIIGAPTDVQGAEALKEISPHQFEWWAVDLVNARPAKDNRSS